VLERSALERSALELWALELWALELWALELRALELRALGTRKAPEHCAPRTACAGWTGRRLGGPVAAWDSPPPRRADRWRATQRPLLEGRLAGSHLTCPRTMQLWTTSLLVYR